jgi:hypothetical protein
MAINVPPASVYRIRRRQPLASMISLAQEHA